VNVVLDVGVGHGGYCVLVLSVGQKPSLGYVINNGAKRRLKLAKKNHSKAKRALFWIKYSRIHNKKVVKKLLK
jgi:hypothetical protein